MRLCQAGWGWDAAVGRGPSKRRRGGYAQIDMRETREGVGVGVGMGALDS
jgi:hypothetical protein